MIFSTIARNLGINTDIVTNIISQFDLPHILPRPIPEPDTNTTMWMDDSLSEVWMVDDSLLEVLQEASIRMEPAIKELGEILAKLPDIQASICDIVRMGVDRDAAAVAIGAALNRNLKPNRPKNWKFYHKYTGTTDIYRHGIRGTEARKPEPRRRAMPHFSRRE